jgi:heme/copper-type cytochrome/quinol oxidase subunit 2
MTDINATHTESDINQKATDDFKVIVIIVLVILLIFLGFFIYNLIKCYLPKWRRQKLHEEQQQTGPIRQIEIEEMY